MSGQPYTPRLKVCGITDHQDAVLCHQLGVHAIGLIFVEESVRSVSIIQACEILQHLPSLIEPVAVTMDHSYDQVMDILSQTGIRTLQLHGHEDFMERLPSCLHIIKAYKNWGRSCYEHLKANRAYVKTLLIDGLPDLGTEEYNLFQEVVHDWNMPLIIAGGLNASNIAQIASQHPYAHMYDLARGVEQDGDQASYPGQKDPIKIREVLSALRLYC